MYRLDNLVHEETEDQTCNNLEQPPFEFGIASDKNGNLILEDTALIDPYLKLPNSKAIYLSLFDGSGGKNVAEYLQHNLYKQILTEFEKTGSTNIENTFTTAYAELDKVATLPALCLILIRLLITHPKARLHSVAFLEKTP